MGIFVVILLSVLLLLTIYFYKGENMKVSIALRGVDIKKLLKHIVIIVDTREQQNKHILDYFDKEKNQV